LELKQALSKPLDQLSERPPVLAASETNALRTASSYFQRLTTNYPNSELIGQAWLDQGWCLWLEGRVPESRVAFARAAELIPFSKNKALALLKLGDANYFLGDLTNATRHYHALLENFVEVSEARAELFDYALYQMLRVHLELGQVEAAAQAMNQLVDEHGQSRYADRAMLLVAQAQPPPRRPRRRRCLPCEACRPRARRRRSSTARRTGRRSSAPRAT
jgi:TolA-binding protein